MAKLMGSAFGSVEVVGGALGAAKLQSIEVDLVVAVIEMILQSLRL